MSIRFIIFGLLLLALSSCNKDVVESANESNENYFREYMNIENNKEQYLLGDTLWFSGDFSNVMRDTRLSEDITLENQTFILHGLVSLLKPQYDSVYFINENFELLIDEGEMKLVNVLNTDPESYSFDIRFGRPLLTNEVKFGLVLNYEAIFSIEFEALVFFGAERQDYDDFSLDNGKGYIKLDFNADTINDSLFYNLPTYYRYYYQNYFYASEISLNKYFFFEVLKE